MAPIEAAIIRLQIRREERYPERKFGQDNLRHKATVRQWL